MMSHFRKETKSGWPAEQGKESEAKDSCEPLVQNHSDDFIK